MHLRLLLVFILSGQTIEGQNRVIDSLLQLHKSHVTEDTVKLSILNELAYAYSDFDNELNTGIRYADSAISLGHRLWPFGNLALAYRNKALLLYYSDAVDRAAGDAYRGLSYAEKANDLKQQANCYFLLGYIHHARGSYDTAIVYLQKAASFFQRIKDAKREAGVMISIGANYTQLSDYPRAMEYYYRALSLYEKVKDSGNYALAVSNLGYVNKQLNNYDKALEFYEKGKDIFYRIDDKRNEADMLMKIGAVYDLKKDAGRALSYYSAAYKINNENNFTKGLAETTANIGIAYVTQEKYDSAFYYLIQAEKQLTKSGDKRNLSVIYNNLGKAIITAPDVLLEKNGFVPSRKFPVAEEFLKKALKIAGEHDLLLQEFGSLQSLSQLYSTTGRYPQAYEALRRAFELQDSIFSDKKRDELTRMEMRFSFEKENSVVRAAHAAEIKQERTVRRFLLAGAGIVGLASVLLFWSYKRRRDARARQKEAELQTQMTDTEMKVLRLQMNPHFIFNSLNSVSDYIRKNNTEEADAFLTRFARIMRMTLENSEKKVITLDEDIKLLDLYLKLESQRLGNKFSYTIQTASVIDAETVLVPPMLLQPFVENSIWHGIVKKESHGTIGIRIDQEDDMLYIVIEDDGIGREKAAYSWIAGKASLGMSITKSRVEMLNRQKEKKAFVKLTDKPDGLIVEIKLPLEIRD